ncbi:MAG: chemotaxis protein CheB [Oceanicoccus sp.]|uniref:chemotaxis protein CheB n=1 Tax=Oceanicoccus sp. TaxID=2691044 RepID=UPI002625C196|nr:chemotaxis protein CheB [Oceanicoccus sp.]MCP3907438.1 chemotaxis protein CheB [Oceanicoccus sp.]
MSALIMPRIGLVTDSDLNRYVLQAVLAEGSYELAGSFDTASLGQYLETNKSTPDIDAWLVDIEDNQIQQSLDLLLGQSDLPLLVNDDIPPVQEAKDHQVWQRRLLEKLEVLVIRPAEAIASSPPVDSSVNKVWVLVASMGGPDAVKRFLTTLPQALPIAMVYGQHIETNFDGLLTSAVTGHDYPMQLASGEQQLVNGNILVVPVDHQLRFLSRGRVVETRKAWSGSYQPVLDQVIADLARIYRQNLGVIVFSGMCNDGEIGCRVAKACGGTVWAQTPNSCLSPDMPSAAISTGCVSKQGTPEQLAEALAEQFSL